MKWTLVLFASLLFVATAVKSEEKGSQELKKSKTNLLKKSFQALKKSKTNFLQKKMMMKPI